MEERTELTERMIQPLTTSERKCVIKGCGNISMFKQSHQFPSMPSRCAAWLRAIGHHLDDDLIGQPQDKFKRRIVCVDHFDPSCISAQSPRYLKRSAVPTIFNTDGHQETAQIRPRPMPVSRGRLPLAGRLRQEPVTYRTIVIPKSDERRQKSFYINKTSAPTTAQPTGPTLLIEPLTGAHDHKDDESAMELPMFYMSSQHSQDTEKGKPALKITKVYPNRKPPGEAEASPTTNVETMLVEREDFPVEYLEDWDEQQLRADTNSDASDNSHENQPLILEAEDVMESEELAQIHESMLPLVAEDWAESKPGAELLNNNVLQPQQGDTWKQHGAVSDHLKHVYVEPTPRCMESTPNVPDCVQYLLLGGGIASVAAFRAIREHDAGAKILVVSQEYSYPYRRHLLSKPEFWSCDDIENLEDAVYQKANGEKCSLYHEPESFYMDPSKLWQSAGVSVARGYTVRRIDPHAHAVVLAAPNRPDCTVQYSSCLIATGSRGVNIPLLETASAEVLSRCVFPRSLWDVRELQRRLAVARGVVVIGGGYLGTEIVCCLAERVSALERQVNITHIFREAGAMWHVLPDYLSRWSMRHLVAQGIGVYNNTEILNAYLKDERVTLELSNAEVVEADLLVVCVGSIPNAEFAAASGLEVHPQLGGIVVNSDFCVQRDLYAAGDVACYYEPRASRHCYRHARHAALVGRACGLQMCGREAGSSRYTQVSSHLGRNVSIQAIGVVDSNLEMMGAFPNLSQNEGSDKNYDKGVVFYLQQREIVGVLMWNLRNRLRTARKVLSRQPMHEAEISELADLFIDNAPNTTLKKQKSPHPESPHYECHHCGQQLTTRPDVVQHLRANHPHRETCTICQQAFTTRVLLRKHYLGHLKGALIP